MAAFAAAALALAVPARAQGDVNGFVTPFSAVFVSVGRVAMNVGDLNARFARPDLLLLVPPQRTGFDAIADHGYTVGIGGYAPVGRALFGGEWNYADIGTESSSYGKTNHLETNYAMATVGFAAWTGWRFTVYPFMGIGLGNVKLTLQDRFGVPQAPLTQDPSFDEIVLNNAPASVINGSYLMFQPGLGFDYLALRDDKSHHGWVIGLRLSTGITPHRTTWTYQGRSVYGAPDVAPAGTMLRVVFGIGGFRMEK
jgi:opacity protein-like surface antigen